jgi:predicted DsbA family dithiol-disulfide isomerase
MLRVTVYTDVICSHSWSVQGSLARLEQEYGQNLYLEYHMYPLVQAAASFNDKWNQLAATREIGPHWGEVSEHLGMPIAHTIWFENPVASTLPFAKAYQAALRQQPPSDHGVVKGTPAWAFYDAVRTAVMAQKRDISDPQILRELALKAGLDGQQFDSDWESRSVALETDGVINAVIAKGVRSRPTVIFTNEHGEEYWVIGPRPWADYQSAVETMLAQPHLPGGIHRVGGRIFGFSDMELVGEKVVRKSSGQLRHWAALFLTGTDPLTPSLLERIHAAVQGCTLISLQGRLQREAISLVGVQAMAGSPAEAMAAAGRGLTGLKEVMGGTSASPELMVKVNRYSAEAEAVVMLKAIPRTDAGRPEAVASAIAGDYLLHLTARPMNGEELDVYLAGLQESLSEIHCLQSDPNHAERWHEALKDSLSIRQTQVERLLASRQAGLWWATPLLLGASQEQLCTAARAAWYEEEVIYPLRTLVLGAEDREHLSVHLRSFTQCLERELQGTYRFQTELTDRELCTYLW